MAKTAELKDGVVARVYVGMDRYIEKERSNLATMIRGAKGGGTLTWLRSRYDKDIYAVEVDGEEVARYETTAHKAHVEWMAAHDLARRGELTPFEGAPAKRSRRR